MEAFNYDWHIEAGENGKCLHDKIEKIKQEWGICPAESPVYTSSIVKEFTCADILEYPEYHALLDNVQSFSDYYKKYFYLHSFQSGISNHIPANESAIKQGLLHTKEYRCFLELFKKLEVKFLKTKDTQRILSLYDKIMAFDRQNEIDIFAYIYTGYQDGYYLNYKLTSFILNDEFMNSLESSCRVKAIAADQSRQSLKGVIQPILNDDKWLFIGE
ncbi:hypothetical protein [Massiliimalia timonensis]|uniref:hypothetical protein n=1 Tax=Massiliimalia timonensis TaxID=1987501 RepID=UPI00189CB6BE|nr:hypothetical protein [Massiliimalia timonensis]